MKIRKFFAKKYRFYWIAAIIALVIAGFFFFRKGEEETLLAVQSEPFLQQVAVSGTVVPVQEVSIAVAQGGSVSSVHVKVGDTVKKGAQLIAINTASLRADLLSAQADVALKKAEIKNKEVNIDQITKEQNTFVDNAYRTMLSDELVAVPDISHDDLTAPVITGRYGGPEGKYQIRVQNENKHAEDYFFFLYGIERIENTPISQLKPTPLGTHGLFISFPDGIENYINTYWEVEIPNKKSGSYLENYNAFIKAVDTKNRTIADAKEELEQTSGNSILMAQLQKAEAGVQSILADIADRIVKAPFDGLITNVDVKVGETASTNQVAVEMISSGAFQIESYVPEIYIPLIKVGNEAQVILDAYGSDKPFGANVVAIDPSKTLRDGLPTYKTTLELKGSSDEIRNGMTANIVITTEKKDNTIAIPQGAVKSRDGKKFVLVQENDRSVEREVAVEHFSSSGQIEIVSGLKAGDMLIISQ